MYDSLNEEDLIFLASSKERNKGKTKPVNHAPKEKIPKVPRNAPTIKSPIEKRYNNYVKRSARKEIEFSLSIEEFTSILYSKCSYCDQPSECIDRIDSSIGYVSDNVQPLCNRCNMMKFTMSESDFFDHLRKIHFHLSKT